MASKGWFRTKKKVEDPNKGEPVEKNKRLFRLSDFELKETLGRGTFSRVRLARHAMDEQHYAIKILKKIDILRLEQLQHTKDEVGILERVQHPFVVKLHGYFMDECRIFMVLVSQMIGWVSEATLSFFRPPPTTGSASRPPGLALVWSRTTRRSTRPLESCACGKSSTASWTSGSSPRRSTNGGAIAVCRRRRWS